MTILHIAPYLLAAVDGRHRVLATAVLGAYGWSAIWREPRPSGCQCERCAAGRGYQSPEPRMVLRQRIHPDIDRAVQHLLVLARRRMEAAA